MEEYNTTWIVPCPHCNGTIRLDLSCADFYAIKAAGKRATLELKKQNKKNREGK